jgi:hypothetical protein
MSLRAPAARRQDGRKSMTTRELLVHGMLFACMISQRSRSLAETAKRSLYLDATQPVETRVEDLLGRMTRAEKIGQINMPCVYERALGADVPSKMEGCRKFTLGQSVPSGKAGRWILHPGEHDPS